MAPIPARMALASAVILMVASGAWGFVHAFDDDHPSWPVSPPAQDALTQSLDLERIAEFRYVDDSDVVVTDELGHVFAMKFTAPCPEFKAARDFSLVTESFRNLDRFTAVSVGGHTCTFRDFALQH